MLGTEWYSDVA